MEIETIRRRDRYRTRLVRRRKNSVRLFVERSGKSLTRNTIFRSFRNAKNRYTALSIPSLFRIYLVFRDLCTPHRVNGIPVYKTEFKSRARSFCTVMKIFDKRETLEKYSVLLFTARRCNLYRETCSWNSSCSCSVLKTSGDCTFVFSWFWDTVKRRRSFQEKYVSIVSLA